MGVESSSVFLGTDIERVLCRAVIPLPDTSMESAVPQSLELILKKPRADPSKAVPSRASGLCSHKTLQLILVEPTADTGPAYSSYWLIPLLHTFNQHRSGIQLLAWF